MAHPNETLLREFYDAFARCDGAAMGAAYHDDARFYDPVFTELDGRGARAMWAMLTERAADLVIEASGIEADDARGAAHWEATYTFSATGRVVHNVIDAEFEFRDGKIAAHTDRFGFYRWSRMALGPVGAVLGWTPLVRNKVRGKARADLDKYRARHNL